MAINVLHCSMFREEDICGAASRPQGSICPLGYCEGSPAG